ncbi:MAG: L-histidine N(alpha)-methyltransferase [Patescibacteria group bacterium]
MKKFKTQAVRAIKALFVFFVFLLSLFSIDTVNYSELYSGPYLHYILGDGEVIESSPLGTYLVRHGKIIAKDMMEYAFPSGSDPDSIKMRSGLDRFDDTRTVPVKTRLVIKSRKVGEYLKPQPVIALAPLAYASRKKEEILNQRLNDQLSRHELQGEQWYRNPRDWLMVAFCNPVHYKCGNNELAILEQYRLSIYPQIANHTQVYYGIGTAETEMELVRWQIESRSPVKLNAIDVSQDFLDIFAGKLAAKQIEYPRKNISANLICDIFQNLDRSRLDLGQTKHSIHICVGNTIGNSRDQAEIFKVFQSNTRPGDKLLLGFQLRNHIARTFKKYRANPYYLNFAVNQIVKSSQIDYRRAKWSYEPKTGFIVLHYGGIEVFRSKKYQVKQVVRELAGHDFAYLDNWVDRYRNSAILLMKKV